MKKYFETHLSLSEWAIQTDLTNKEDIIKEDGTKRKRLQILNESIGLPIVKSYSFSYGEITEPSDSFRSFKMIAGEQDYALRVQPKVAGLPILRNRKLKVPELLKWIMSETIDFANYEYSFEPHIDPEVATIFIVEEKRIIGEFASGSILQLNKGIHEDKNSIYFEYDFSNWSFSNESKEIKTFLEEAFEFIYLKDKNKQVLFENNILESMNANFLNGYFEVIGSKKSGIVFIDYNRSLKNNLNGIELFREKRENLVNLIRGNVGCSGKVIGKAKVIKDEEIESAVIEKDEILVCHFTSPDYLPLIIASAAVVTDIGGILSHAAIVCRELKKPCIIGTKVATQKIKTGDLIEVDALEGIIKFL